MNITLLNEAGGQRSFAVVLEAGEEAMAQLQGFARQHKVSAAQVTAIGAFSRADLAFWDVAARKYLPIPVESQVEVLSLIGDIVLDEKGEPACHLHAVLGLPDGSVRGGHFASATVRPTLEVIVQESPAHLRRRFDPKLGLAVIAAGA